MGCVSIIVFTSGFRISHPVQADITKLQILTMASKMFVKFGEMVELHFIYILNLAKYDQSYDVRVCGDKPFPAAEV